MMAISAAFSTHAPLSPTTCILRCSEYPSEAHYSWPAREDDMHVAYMHGSLGVRHGVQHTVLRSMQEPVETAITLRAATGIPPGSLVVERMLCRAGSARYVIPGCLARQMRSHLIARSSENRVSVGQTLRGSAPEGAQQIDTHRVSSKAQGRSHRTGR